MKKITRRTFVKAATAIGAFSILPSGIRANPPSSRLTYALIGCGGNGNGTTRKMMSHPKLQLVALCDPDEQQIVKCQKKLAQKGAKIDTQNFKDYREMFSKMGDKIDAVAVSTPDHNHYPVTMEAMKHGKHVYTQKPLTNKISHARELAKFADETAVVNRMGIQMHSSMGNRVIRYFLKQGSIGKIKQVYVWSYKKWGDNSMRRKPALAVPKHLDWSLWLGGAPKQPYRDGIHPGNWRRYLDFGVGTLGDMGVHIFDTPFAALELSYPNWVRTTCREPNGFGHPTANTVEYSFEETKYTTKDFRWTWFDGDHFATMQIPELKLPKGKKLPDQGAVYIGEKGIMLHPHGSGPQFFPDELKQTLKRPDLEPMNHYHDWIDACLAGKPSAHADFDYAARLTETVLLGVVGSRFPGEKLKWNGRKMKFMNIPEANAWV